MNKTILITTSTGFLGTYIRRFLTNARFHVKLLVRNTQHVKAKERYVDIFFEEERQKE